MEAVEAVEDMAPKGFGEVMLVEDMLLMEGIVIWVEDGMVLTKCWWVQGSCV